MNIEKGYVIRMSVGRYNNYTNDTEEIFDWINKITQNTELAIEASSWCEIACVEETFENESFSLQIVEDN